MVNKRRLFHPKIIICEGILSDRKNFKSGFVIWRGQRTIGNFLKPFTPNPALDCGIPWHHTTPAPLLPRTTSGPAPWCVWPKSSRDANCVVSQLLAFEEVGLDFFCKQTASGAHRNGSEAEKQGPEVAAAHLLLPPPPVPPSAPPTASVTFALCSSCRVLWKGHLQLLAALWQRGERAMWWEAAATGRKRGQGLDSYPLTT